MSKEEKEQLLNVKVRDHDHITGLYRGPAHGYCNSFYNVQIIVNMVLKILHAYL